MIEAHCFFGDVNFAFIGMGFPFFPVVSISDTGVFF